MMAKEPMRLMMMPIVMNKQCPHSGSQQYQILLETLDLAAETLMSSLMTITRTSDVPLLWCPAAGCGFPGGFPGGGVGEACVVLLLLVALSSTLLCPDRGAAKANQVKGSMEGLISLLLAILPPIPLPTGTHCAGS